MDVGTLHLVVYTYRVNWMNLVSKVLQVFQVNHAKYDPRFNLYNWAN